jgi:hypothetical protein
MARSEEDSSRGINISQNQPILEREKFHLNYRSLKTTNFCTVNSLETEDFKRVNLITNGDDDFSFILEVEK